MKVKLSDGARSTAYRDGDRTILKGKNHSTYERFIDDVNNLNAIKRYINNIQIPTNARVIHPSKEFPFGGMSYDYIPGRSLQPKSINDNNIDNIAYKLADFLKQLEVIKPENIFPDFDKKEVIREEKEQINISYQLITPYLNEEQKEKLKVWVNDYLNYLDSIKEFNVIHGDLWFENIIIDDNQQELVGIIDFEQAKVFDKAVDYTSILWMGKDFVIKILQRNKLPKDYINTLLLFNVRTKVLKFDYILKGLHKETPTDRLKELNKKLNQYFDSNLD